MPVRDDIVKELLGGMRGKLPVTDAVQTAVQREAARACQSVGGPAQPSGSAPSKLPAAAVQSAPARPPADEQALKKAEEQANKVLYKTWDASHFGQGREDGGAAWHRQNRLEALFRLRNLSKALGHPVPETPPFPAFVSWFERRSKTFCSTSRAFGSEFLRIIRGLDEEIKTTNPKAFLNFYLRNVEHMPAETVDL